MSINLEYTLQFKIYTAVSGLPEDWDNFGENNIFLSREYLKVLETSAPKNMSCFFIGIFDGDILCGKAISQFLDLSDVSSFGERDHCLKNIIRTFVFKRFSSTVLLAGNNMLTGQNTCMFKDNIKQEDVMKSLYYALRQIRHILADKGFHTSLTIWKDFPKSQANRFGIAEFKNFHRFTTQPNMVFDIRPEWHTAEDYVSGLNKKYRDQYKRARKKSDSLTKRKMSLHDMSKYNDKIYHLYLTVAKNAPFNTFYLHENHFIELKESLKDKFLFYGYFLEDELIGFNTLIKNGKDIDTYFLGYDEKYQREKMLYLNMLYDMIEYSVNKKFRRIIFARTALEIKSSVGARPADLFGFIKHSNPIINLFMPRLFQYFEPKMAWQQRHPFKD